MSCFSHNHDVWKEKYSRRPGITIHSLEGTELGLRTNFSGSVKGAIDRSPQKILKNLGNSQQTC